MRPVPHHPSPSLAVFTSIRRRLVLLGALALVVVGLVAPPAEASRVASSQPAAGDVVATTVAFNAPAYRRGIARHTRETRKAHGVRSVSWNGCLNVVAREWATHLARTNTFHHENLNPVLSRCHLRAVGENLALGYTYSPTTIRAWMSSSSHRANMLRPGYNKIGVGTAHGPRGWITVQLLGRSY